MEIMKLNKHFIFICILFWASSCGKSEEKIPDHVIPIEQMAGILADIELAEVILGYHLDTIDYFDSILVGRYYADIFRHHRIQGSSFSESWKFYQNHPTLGEMLYEQTINKLRKQEEQ